MELPHQCLGARTGGRRQGCRVDPKPALEQDDEPKKEQDRLTSVEM